MYSILDQEIVNVISLPSPTFDSNVNISSSSGIFFRSSPALLSPKPEKIIQFHFSYLTLIIVKDVTYHVKTKKVILGPF